MNSDGKLFSATNQQLTFVSHTVIRKKKKKKRKVNTYHEFFDSFAQHDFWNRIE